MKKSDLTRFFSTYDLTPENTIVIPYGSRVYGTHAEYSDYDYIAIVPNSKNVNSGEEFDYGGINVHIYKEADFQEQLHAHKIHALEAWFYKDNEIHAELERRFKFALDVTKLRHELSAKASHSFVKAKKKLTVEKALWTGLKSLFHSLRILEFGIQIARDGDLTDFNCANHWWNEIAKSGQWDWDYFKRTYQPIYNSLASEFRRLAPKE